MKKTNRRVSPLLRFYGLKIEDINEKNIKIINSLDEYLGFLNEYIVAPINNQNGKKTKKHEFVFRGISNKNEKYATITRQYYNKDFGLPSENNNHANQLFNKELLYIRKFEQNASFVLQEGHTTLDIIAAAQHNRTKTRLIDWTTSPLIATLFSLYKTPEELFKNGSGYYLVLAVDKSKHITVLDLTSSDNFKGEILCNHYIHYGSMLSELMRVYQSNDKVAAKEYFLKILKKTHTVYSLAEDGITIKSEAKNKAIEEKIAKKFVENKMMFLESNFSNNRLVNQRGLFQIAIDPNKKYMDKLFKDIDLIFISSGARNDIIKYCEAIGVNFYSLMPDPQNIANEINRRQEVENCYKHNNKTGKKDKK